MSPICGESLVRKLVVIFFTPLISTLALITIIGSSHLQDSRVSKILCLQNRTMDAWNLHIDSLSACELGKRI